MSRKVDEYIMAILEKEGEACTDDPKDSGGKTKWGITEQTARAYGYPNPIEQLSEHEAFNIYLQRYWLAPRFDSINPLHPILAERLMDFGVLAGPATAVKHLQRCLNVLNINESVYQDIAVDGMLGPMTLHVLNKFFKTRGAEGKKLLVGMVVAMQSVYLIELAEKRPKDERYIYGWQLNRAIGNLLWKV